jgi:hypothetical protein
VVADVAEQPGPGAVRAPDNWVADHGLLLPTSSRLRRPDRRVKPDLRRPGNEVDIAWQGRE